MKIYEILDQENALSVGTLLYYEKSRTFIIELMDCLDEWNAPLLLTAYVKRGTFTIPRDISLMWVRERIIPSGRQNIGMILRSHKLSEYDEMTFLEKSGGRCSQDSLYIRRLSQIPDYVKERRQRNLKDCTLCAGRTLLCFFLDGTVKKVSLNSYKSSDENENTSECEITIREGKFHQVKRMFAAVGKEVLYLKRLRMGPLTLDPALPVGAWRRLTAEEIRALTEQ